VGDAIASPTVLLCLAGRGYHGTSKKAFVNSLLCCLNAVVPGSLSISGSFELKIRARRAMGKRKT